MTSSALPDSFRRFGDLAEIRGASSEAAAWRRLAVDIERTGPGEIERLRELAGFDRLPQLTGVPSSLHSTLREILTNGPDPALRAARTQLPWLLHNLLELPALDSESAATLARAGVVTPTDLAVALHDGRVDSHLPHHASRIRAFAERLSAERPRLTLGRAVELLDGLMARMASACPQLDRVTPAGDVRRVEPIVESLALVAQAADPPSAVESVADVPGCHLLHRAGRRALVHYQQAEVDVRVVPPDEFGSALHAATGSPAHVTAMRARQGSPGIRAREEDVYAHDGLTWIPPELRLGAGEIEAAAEGRIPRLVTREDIRGDLHIHTTYSDGRESLAEMVEAAAALGYEYVAITDHSERAAATNTLSRAALARQRDEIGRLRERFPALTILHGAEVDILADGRLDFPDDVLASLDIVLASLHESHGHDPARLTRRCIRAIEHPLVNVITHPANRLVGRHAGYDLDFAAVYAAAAATGTALEIDGAPSHLDLDGEHARAAIAAGVTVTIDSDCHQARLLDRQMRLGVGTARRGWVEPRHVLNTRSIGELRRFVRAKRSRSR